MKNGRWDCSSINPITRRGIITPSVVIFNDVRILKLAYNSQKLLSMNLLLLANYII